MTIDAGSLKQKTLRGTGREGAALVEKKGRNADRQKLRNEQATPRNPVLSQRVYGLKAQSASNQEKTPPEKKRGGKKIGVRKGRHSISQGLLPFAGGEKVPNGARGRRATLLIRSEEGLKQFVG